MLLEVVKSNRKNKRYMAIFSDGKKSHFGLDTGSTYIDHHDIIKRFNYLKRHEVNEESVARCVEHVSTCRKLFHVIQKFKFGCPVLSVCSSVC